MLGGESCAILPRNISIAGGLASITPGAAHGQECVGRNTHKAHADVAGLGHADDYGDERASVFIARSADGASDLIPRPDVLLAMAVDPASTEGPIQGLVTIAPVGDQLQLCVGHAYVASELTDPCDLRESISNEGRALHKLSLLLGALSQWR